MIEVVFSDSACGSLKMAQHCGEGSLGGCIGVIISHSDGSKPTKKEIRDARRAAEEEERLAWESAVPLGGESSDVYGFGLAQSIGDISEDIPGVRRQRELERLYRNDYGEGDSYARELVQKANEKLNAIRSRAASGEPLRVWYSSQPDELCGLVWFMARLDSWKECSGPVFLIQLPEWEAHKPGSVKRCISCGEVSPEGWHRYLPLQREAPPALRQGCAAYWKTLQAENAPLRAVLNGALVSAPETLYDDFIAREIAAEGEEFQEAMVVGRVLSKYQLGIGDAWVALRIEEKIRAGGLIVAAEAEAGRPYCRTLRKCAGG